MKTIFITSFHSLISRNILATPVLDGLLAHKDTRIVLFCSRKNTEIFLREEFGPKGTIIELIGVRPNWYDRVLNYLALCCFRTTTLKIKRESEMRRSGKYLSLLLGSSIGRKFVRLLSTILTPRGTFTAYCEKYKPDLVFLTDMQSHFDVRMWHDAKKYGVPAVGMVRSWDNLSSKGLLRFVPDRVIVNNMILKNEAITLHNIPREKIDVVGIPHYDLYRMEDRMPRDEFFRSLGADPAKRAVLYVPTGDRYLKNNTIDRDIIKILDESLPGNCQIIVRFPPADTVKEAQGLEKPGRVIFDTVRGRFQTLKNTELSREDDRHLADLVFWSNVVVSGPSTIAIDAAFFDKPIVLVGFDGSETRPYYEGMRRFYDYDHFVPIVHSGGVKLAKTKEEFLRFIAAYLSNPTLDREGREKIVEMECFAADGKSSERLLGVLFKHI